MFVLSEFWKLCAEAVGEGRRRLEGKFVNVSSGLEWFNQPRGANTTLTFNTVQTLNGLDKNWKLSGLLTRQTEVASAQLLLCSCCVNVFGLRNFFY